jgi:hypothetical protein
MKRFVVALAVLAAMSGTAFADHGTTDFVQAGKVLVGDGFSPVAIVAEGLDCSEGARGQGVDAYLVKLPDGAANHNLSVSWTADDLGLNDFDVYFLDGECAVIDNGAATAGSNNPEAGVVPEGAVFAEVDLFTGANASFTLTVEKVLP